MHFHSQNLNEDEHGRTGAMWHHGRCWWRDNEARRWNCRFEWSILRGRGFCHVGIEFGGRGDDDNVMIKFALPYLFSFFLSFGGPWKWWPFREAHDFELAYHNGAIWWKIGSDPTGNRSWPRTRWTRVIDGSFYLSDFFFGRRDYKNEILKVEKVQIPMYEKSYEATVTLSESTWTRRRWPYWPLKEKGRYANIELDREAPGVPGKGENSWDCGEDAIWGLSCPASTVHDAIGAYVAAVIRTRRRYGSKDWRPEEEHRKARPDGMAEGSGMSGAPVLIVKGELKMNEK